VIAHELTTGVACQSDNPYWRQRQEEEAHIRSINDGTAAGVTWKRYASKEEREKDEAFMHRWATDAEYRHQCSLEAYRRMDEEWLGAQAKAFAQWEAEQKR
jgi:hypothetical protein